MDKLIVVGMRYQNQEDIARIVKQVQARKPGEIATPVTLVMEKNVEGYQGIAVGVYSEDQTKKYGYVRNKDLEEFLEYAKPKLNDRYVIQACRANYWILQKVSEYPFLSPRTSTHYTELKEKFSNENLQNTHIKKEETKMAINTNSMRDNFFREVKNVAIDIQTGKFGILSSEGISVFVDGGISVNPIQELGVKIPAFAFRVAVADLKVGDIVISGTDTSFFKGKTDNGYEVLTLSGEVKTVGNVTNMFFGKNTVLAVRNMFGEGTNPMLMAMMMGDGKDFDMKTFALMSMMGGGAGMGGEGMNPMLMAMMLSK